MSKCDYLGAWARTGCVLPTGALSPAAASVTATRVLLKDWGLSQFSLEDIFIGLTREHNEKETAALVEAGVQARRPLFSRTSTCNFSEIFWEKMRPEIA